MYVYSNPLKHLGSDDGNGSKDSSHENGQPFIKFDAYGASVKQSRVNTLSSAFSSGQPSKVETMVIHTGIKNYWRINTNVEFHFIEQMKYDVIEIIAYKAETEEEAPRSYLNYSKVLGKCSQEDILTRLNNRREDFIRKKVDITPLVSEELELLAKHAAIAQYILARLVVDSEVAAFRIKFVAAMGDVYDEELEMCDVECDRPENMSDTVIPRKRKTT
jgi:hypothetical protein